jgi:hypothetical protein
VKHHRYIDADGNYVSQAVVESFQEGYMEQTIGCSASSAFTYTDNYSGYKISINSEEISAGVEAQSTSYVHTVKNAQGYAYSYTNIVLSR